MKLTETLLSVQPLRRLLEITGGEIWQAPT